MESTVGVKTIMMCSKDTLLTTRQHLFVAGHRDKAEFIEGNHIPLKTVRNKTLEVLKNFKLTNKSFMATIGRFWYLDQMAKQGGCDAQIVFTPQINGGPSSGGVFNFIGEDYFFGLMFEFLISNKERSLKYDLEVAMEPYLATSLKTQSLLNAPIDISNYGHGNTGETYNFVVQPSWLSLTEGGVNLFKKSELVEYNCLISTKETEKTLYNRSKVDYYSIKVDITGTDATITKLLETQARYKSNELKLTQRFDAQYNDVLTFQSGVLSRVEDPVLADDKRHLKVSYEGEIPKGKLLVSPDAHGITVSAE